MTRIALLIASLIVPASCSGAAVAPAPCPTVPAAIDPGALGVTLAVHARGVQTYACSAGTWTLIAPRAELFDDAGALVGHHAAGPSWTLTDGSQIAGTKLASAVVDASSIPWLLVGVSGGAGRFAAVTRVERIHTTGGVAPATCTAADRSPLDVPYTADYVFFAATAPRCAR